MKKYLALMAAVILMASLIQVAYGETRTVIVKEKEFSIETGTESIPYFVSPNHFMDRNQPVVCMHESPNTGYDLEVYEEITKGAIANWVDKLYEVTGDNGQWYLHYVMVPEDDPNIAKYTNEYKYCDINVIFDNNTPLDISTGAYIKGGTWHYKSVNHWADVKIYTWDYQTPEIKVDKDGNRIAMEYRAVYSPPEVMQQVLEHELGHAFGLKHHEIDMKFYEYNDYQKEWAKKSMMYYATSPQYDEDKKIRDVDIGAIIYKYTMDGWGGKTNVEADRYIR